MAQIDDRAQKAYEIICQNPGITSWGISKKMGIDYRAVDSVLARLDNKGLLVYQDDKGRLYRFE